MGPKKSSSSSNSSSKDKDKEKDKKDVKGSVKKEELFVPVPGQKLTREQHAILRAQRAKAAEEEKKALFGSWTGKTPVSVLHEHCQRMEWAKVQIDVAKKGNKGYVGTVTLAKESPKTREKVLFTYVDPDFSRVYPTEQEAKHWAATYCLHRVASHLSLHRLLPPSHQSYWATLEAEKKTKPAEEQKWEYAPDPFAVQDLKDKETKLKDRETKLEQEKLTKELEKASKPWEAYQKVDLSPELRKMIEDLLHNEQEPGEKSSEAAELDASGRQIIIDTLVQKGFRSIHIEESLQCNSDYKSCLDWLCLMVPEDDLPPAFLSKSTSVATQGSSSIALLNQERAVDYMSKTGFDHDICRRELNECDGDELLALASLALKLSNEECIPIVEQGAEESQSTWSEEIEALCSIYGTENVSRNDRNHMIQIKIDFSNSITVVTDAVELHIGVSEKSSYPNTLPALLIYCPSLPAYIRLALLKKLAVEARSKWLGHAMVFDAVSWISDHFLSVIENPGVSLTQLKSIGKSVATKTATSSPVIFKAKSVGASNGKRKQAKPQESEADLDAKGLELKLKFEKDIQNDEYKAMFRSRQNLPSYQFRDQIINGVETNQVVIVCGETGCGKSTQTGQFLLEHMLSSGKGGRCNIICTQPRRISAISLAERVAAERAEKVGETIGYFIRGESMRSSQTRMMFCTTGILLRMLQGDPSLNRVTHVIVDEVHERSVDSDFLLVILRELLVKRPDFRLILMSATIDSHTFSNYFNGAPVLEIPGFTHPVTDVYVEDLLQQTKFIPDPRSTRGQQSSKPESKAGVDSTKPSRDDATAEELRLKYETMGLEVKAVNWLLRESPNDSVDYSLVAATVKHICDKGVSDGAILIFLQGAMEIKRCIDTIAYEVGELHKLELYPLHSQLSSKEQSAVFRRPKKGFRKVVVSTNVAETSITIDDVVYVIDSGRVKEMRYENSTLCLVDVLASRASCKQRRGRAGRVKPGTCYKLYSRNLETTHMLPQPIPEILRVPLEQLCLNLKAMGVEDLSSFLGKAIEAPSKKNIDAAENVLRELHAIDTRTSELTPLGRHMSSIPADLRLSKILIFGSIFKCVHNVLTIAAILSSKSPFVAPHDKRDEARVKRLAFLWDKSDLLTDCKAYDAWTESLQKGKRAEREFCETNFISSAAMVAISDLRRQYLDILIDIGFVASHEREVALAKGGVCNLNANDSSLIKGAIVAGLYPQIASIKHPDVTYVETAHGAVEREALAHEIEFTVSKGIPDRMTSEASVSENEQQERVLLHPSSVLCGITKFEDFMLAHHQKVATSKLFLRDATMVSPWPVLMFGGALEVDHDGKTVSVDGFAKIHAYPRIAVLAEGLRKLLDKALAQKVKDPTLDILSASFGIGPVLVHLFSQKSTSK